MYYLYISRYIDILLELGRLSHSRHSLVVCSSFSVTSILDCNNSRDSGRPFQFIRMINNLITQTKAHLKVRRSHGQHIWSVDPEAFLTAWQFGDSLLAYLRTLLTDRRPLPRLPASACWGLSVSLGLFPSPCASLFILDDLAGFEPQASFLSKWSGLQVSVMMLMIVSC